MSTPHLTEEVITRKVKVILAALLRLEEEEIQPECELVADLGADSLDLVEFVMALEEEFVIDISDEEADSAKTVQDVITLLVGLLNPTPTVPA